MTLTLINCTVKDNQFATVTDTDDAGLDADVAALTGPVLLIPLIDGPALATTATPQTQVSLGPIDGYIDTDGQLKDKRGGTVGVRVPANDPILGLTRLPYRVVYNLTTAIGQPVKIPDGLFDAPATDTVVWLPSVARVPGTGALGITKGDPGQGLKIDGVAATYGALPGSAADGDVWLVTADGKLYVRSGGAWPANGAGISLQGPQGDPGAPGSDGTDGVDGQPQGMYAASIGNGAATTITVTHNLGTKDLIVGFRLVSTGEVVDVDPVTHIDNNSFSVTFATAPSANAVRVIAVGGAIAVGSIDGGSL